MVRVFFFCSLLLMNLLMITTLPVLLVLMKKQNLQLRGATGYFREFLEDLESGMQSIF